MLCGAAVILTLRFIPCESVMLRSLRFVGGLFVDLWNFLFLVAFLSS